ncbi:hypothetical protein ASF12_19180 [Paenibacillus sp. Leaf72]|nr:hypothetical protein ASF12_19180 [Paenibacillus sp. Leaf72]
MSKYLLKLLAYSLVLGILPTIIIGFASYSIASGDMEGKVKEMNMQWPLESVILMYNLQIPLLRMGKA